MKLILPAHICGPAYAILGDAKIERMAMIAALYDQPSDSLRVFSVLIPNQLCSSAFVETDDARGGEDQIAAWQFQCREQYPERIIGWWHTHPNMTPTPSGQDHSTTAKWGVGSIMLITTHDKGLSNAYLLDRGERSGGTFTIPMTIEWEYDKAPFSSGGWQQSRGKDGKFLPLQSQPMKEKWRDPRYKWDPLKRDYVLTKEALEAEESGEELGEGTKADTSERTVGGVPSSSSSTATTYRRCESCGTIDICTYTGEHLGWACTECRDFWRDRADLG
jgi:proteasome lid subunit RPN8/RPN11